MGRAASARGRSSPSIPADWSCARDGIYLEMARQAEQAMAEADAIVFLTDGREGMRDGDAEIARRLRKLKARVWLVVNKTEGMASDAAVAEFHALGLGQPQPIS